MPDFDLHRARLSLFLVVCASLAGCGSFNGASSRIAGLVTPYKIDVVQGNVASIFHTDRWDYVFTFKRQGVEPQSRRVTVFFKDDVLERFEADTLPTEAEFVASLDSGRKAGKVPVLEVPEEELKALPAPVKEADSKPLSPLPASYPPLEQPAQP